MEDQTGTTTDDTDLDETADDAEGSSSDQSAGRNADEVEAIWRKRVSNKDKAHAAAEKALRDQITAMQAQASGRQSSSTDGGDQSDAELRTLREELAAEKQARMIDQRKAKYPALAKQVGNADDIFGADEATLAKLNALADEDGDDGKTLIAPTSPSRRTPAPPKTLDKMNKQELLDALKRASDRMVANQQ